MKQMMQRWAGMGLLAVSVLTVGGMLTLLVAVQTWPHPSPRSRSSWLMVVGVRAPGSRPVPQGQKMLE